MSILFDLLASVVGGVLFLFLFWKRLKEDYSETLIFNAGILIIAASLGMLLITSFASSYIPESVVFRPSELWFWGGFSGFLAGFLYSISRLKLRVIETFEAASLGFLAWLTILYLRDFFVSRLPYSLALSLLCLFLFALFWFVDKRYKRFSWYKSGRIGFSGFLIAGVYFLIRIIFALFAPASFSITGRLDIVPSAVVTFLLFFSLYNLSER